MGLVAVLVLASEVSLPVVPGAVDVVRRGRAASPSVEYDVRESYPAPQTTRFLLDAMSRRGWRLVEAGGFKSAWPRPADLPGFDVGNLGEHYWTGRWRGRGGREAVFRLRYSCPMEAAGMHSVWVRVAGDIHGAEEAARAEATRKRIREECQGRQAISPECEK